MKTAREAKLKITERLAQRGMFLRDVVEWDLHADDDDFPGAAFVYFSWHGGTELASFDWPWDPATFDVAAGTSVA